MTTRIKVFLLASGMALAIAVVPAFLPTGPTTGLDASGLLASGQFALAAGLIFLGGLLTALTPCVYPLIPITVSVFGARQAESRAKAVGLTGAYVLGMGAVFSVLGVAAALSGRAFGSALGSPWVAAGLALFLVVLASSMFGAFELALPSAWASRLSRVGGSGVVGALLMGSVSGFLAAPCTGPVLTGVLAFVAKSQDPFLGGALLFAYALGIGVPFFLLGVFTVRLPKSGEWMEWVKSFFGIALLALAAMYLRDAVPALRALAAAAASALGQAGGIAFAAALVFLGVAVGAIHRTFKGKGAGAVLKAAGVLAVVLAVLVRTGAAHAPPPEGTAQVVWTHLFPEKVPARAPLESFEAALSRAREQNKPVMIDFYADWCAACKELDRETYVAKDVVGESTRFVNIKVDATNEDDLVQTLYARFRVQGLPTVAFVDSAGAVLENPRVTGFLEPERFLLEQRKVR